MSDAAVFALTFAPTSVLVSLVAWAVVKGNAVDGAVPDPLAGIRTRATKASPEAWVRAHRTALPIVRAVVLPGAGLGVLAVCLAATSSGVPALAIPAAVTACAAFAVAVSGCVIGAVAADRAARRPR